MVLGGGESHLGSVGAMLAGEVHQFTWPGHKEGELVAQVAKRLAESREEKILVIGGIHYDEISQEQIEQILAKVDRLTKQLIHWLNRA